MLVGVHSSLVIRLGPGETAIAILFVCAAILTEASPVAELPRSVIMSTLSLSNQFRAIFTATSALLALSATTTSIGLPSTWPPKSATAIRTASAAPGPAISEKSGHVGEHTDLHDTIGYLGVSLGCRAGNARHQRNRRGGKQNFQY